MIKSIFTASLTFITFAHGLAVTDALVTKASSDPVDDVTFPPGITIPGPDPTPRSDLPPGVQEKPTPRPQDTEKPPISVPGPDPTPLSDLPPGVHVDSTPPPAIGG